ncbi:unnamed protein product [Arctogadus glacialis]
MCTPSVCLHTQASISIATAPKEKPCVCVYVCFYESGCLFKTHTFRLVVQTEASPQTSEQQPEMCGVVFIGKCPVGVCVFVCICVRVCSCVGVSLCVWDFAVLIKEHY